MDCPGLTHCEDHSLLGNLETNNKNSNSLVIDIPQSINGRSGNNWNQRNSLIDLEKDLNVDQSLIILENGEKRWKCTLCSKLYTAKHNLVTHMLGHAGVRRFTCEVCNKAFKQQSHLNAHRLIHSDRRPHECPTCQRQFCQAAHLKRHMLVHQRGNFHKCHICNRRFAFPSELRVHLEKHKQEGTYVEGENQNTHNTEGSTGGRSRRLNQITCEVCQRVFMYPSQLKDHIVVHTQTRRYSCTVCGMKFMKEHHLKAHRFTHSSVKPFFCPICGRSFSLKANMERHVLIHSADKRFTCEVCGKKFTQAQTLRAHMVSHSEVKPYSCSICGKGLSRAHNLRAHMAIHKNNKPHKCSICASSFTLKGNLQRHMKEKHGSVEVVSRKEVAGNEVDSGSNDAGISSQHVTDAQEYQTAPNDLVPKAAKRRKSTPKRLKKYGSAEGEIQDDDEGDDPLQESDRSNEEEVESIEDGTQSVPVVPETILSTEENSGESTLPQSSRLGDVFHTSSNYFPSYSAPDFSSDHKPFSYLHSAQHFQVSLGAPSYGHVNSSPIISTSPISSIMSPLAQNYYVEHPGFSSSCVPPPIDDITLKVQTVHSAIDDLAGKLNSPHDKVAALHAAISDLVNTPSSSNMCA
ncbi:zinc finger protein 366-like [Limulus polyphemus]|uniref:Zinc finger protein 366-like n=1 Tax=Limulus polyphemus TaxID=6850 RepID=A0ABM1TLS6_LIMPO|nr:zinc finger protein 366-like [Limulus polyphemus]XP_022256832.1 zinc finger protein 366-like [Limulus polyphemus]